MTREEAIRRLKNISSHAIHTIEEESFIMSLDDGIAIKMAIEALEPKTIQEIQAESEKYQKAFEDGYEQGYAQARFDYEQEPCEDAISRQYLLDNCVVDKVTMPYVPISKIQEAPPANQQEPKTGHWIDTDEGFSPCECSECESVEFIKSKFCPNCGARMAESEES